MRVTSLHKFEALEIRFSPLSIREDYSCYNFCISDLGLDFHLFKASICFLRSKILQNTLRAFEYVRVYDNKLLLRACNTLHYYDCIFNFIRISSLPNDMSIRIYQIFFGLFEI